MESCLFCWLMSQQMVHYCPESTTIIIKMLIIIIILNIIITIIIITIIIIIIIVIIIIICISSKVPQSPCVLPGAAVEGNCLQSLATRMGMEGEGWGACPCPYGHTPSSTGPAKGHQMHLQNRLQQLEVHLQEAWHWVLCCMCNLQRNRVYKLMSGWEWKWRRGW